MKGGKKYAGENGTLVKIFLVAKEYCLFYHELPKAVHRPGREL